MSTTWSARRDYKGWGCWIIDPLNTLTHETIDHGVLRKEILLESAVRPRDRTVRLDSRGLRRLPAPPHPHLSRKYQGPASRGRDRGTGPQHVGGATVSVVGVWGWVRLHGGKGRVEQAARVSLEHGRGEVSVEGTMPGLARWMRQQPGTWNLGVKQHLVGQLERSIAVAYRSKPCAFIHSLIYIDPVGRALAPRRMEGCYQCRLLGGGRQKE